MSTRFLTSTIENLADGKQDEIGQGGLQISAISGLEQELIDKQPALKFGPNLKIESGELDLNSSLGSDITFTGRATFEDCLYTKTTPNPNSSGFVRFYDNDNSHYLDLHCPPTVTSSHNVILPTSASNSINLLSDEDIIPVNKGGSGQTSYTDGDLLVGKTSGNTLVKRKLAQAGSVTIANGTDGTITISGTDTTYSAGSNISIIGNQISLATTALSNVTLNSFTSGGKQITCPSTTAGTLALVSDLTIASISGLQNALAGKQSTIADGDLTIAKTSGLESRISTIEGTFDGYHPLNGSFSSQLVASSGIIVKNGSSSSDQLTIDVSNAYANIKNKQNGNLNLMVGSSSTTPALTINSTNQAVAVGGGIFDTYQPATAFEVRANSSQTANVYATVQVTSQNASCEPSLQLVNTATSKTSILKMDSNGAVVIDNNLSVNGMMTSVNVLRVEKKGSQNGYIELKETLNSNGLVDSSNSARMYFSMAGTAYIYWDGTNVVTTPQFNPSDERVKTHKTKVEADELAQAFDSISLYKYKYHEHFARDKGVDPEKYVYGFIAQDVREQTSHLSSQFTNVSTGEAVYPNEKVECEGERLKVPNMETINKTDMIMLLWAKVKELQNRMHALESA